MKRLRPASLILPAFLTAHAGAANLETQHAVDVTLPLKPRLELILHSRVRTQPAGLGFYQIRAGPIVSWDATDRIALLAGYYYAQQERKAGDAFIAGHRLFSGAEVSVAGYRRLAFDQRALVERLLSDAAPDFNRYRFRSRLSVNRPLAPYTSHEFFFDSQGWRSTRHSAGVRWSPIRGIQLDLGYLYEHRRLDVGQSRHILLTSLHFKKTSRRADPDL